MVNNINNEYYFNKAIDALFDGEVEVFNSITNKEISINAVDGLGNTFLHYACSQNNLSATMFLLNRKINRYAVNKNLKWASDMADNDVSMHLMNLYINDAVIVKKVSSQLFDRFRKRSV